MNHPTLANPSRPLLRGQALVLIISAALAGSLAPTAARSAVPDQGIRIAVTQAQLNDARSLAKVRRQIAIAAYTLCDTGGLAAIHRDAARRCRERTIADAERQLQVRLASGAGGSGTADLTDF
jgi:UrcA family protein